MGHIHSCESRCAASLVTSVLCSWMHFIMLTRHELSSSSPPAVLPLANARCTSAALTCASKVDASRSASTSSERARSSAVSGRLCCDALIPQSVCVCVCVLMCAPALVQKSNSRLRDPSRKEAKEKEPFNSTGLPTHTTAAQLARTPPRTRVPIPQQ